MNYSEQLEGTLEGCRLRLVLDSPYAAWQEDVTGTLFFEGGPQPLRLQVDVGLELYPDQLTKGQELLPHRRWKAIQVGREEAVRACFELRVPWGIPFRPMQVRAVTRSGWLRWSVLSASVEIAPPRAFQHLASLVEEIAGGRLTGWDSSSLGDGVTAELVPRDPGARQFERLALELFKNNGIIYGNLNIDPLHQSVADRVRSAVGSHPVTVPFRFAEEDAASPRTFFTRALRPYLDDLRELPIPAAHPSSTRDGLPLPALGPIQGNGVAE